MIIFSDTKGEKPATYKYIEYLQNWLKKVNFPELVIVTKQSMYSSLEEQCLRTKTLPSLAYGWKSCSEKWKIKPIAKYCNHWQPAKDVWKTGGKCTKAIGYDAGEERRAKIKEDKKYVYWHPLIEGGVLQTGVY